MAKRLNMTLEEQTLLKETPPQDQKAEAAAPDKSFPVKLRVYMDSFEDEKTHKKTEYVAAELIEPFPEYAEDFNHVRVSPRWDSESAIFKFRMGRYLRTSDDILIEGVCKSVGYPSKKPEEKGVMVYYPGLFFKVPYRTKPVEFGFKQRKEKDKNGNTVFKDSGDSYIFRDLVSELWGGSYEPGVTSSGIDETVEG